MNSRHLTRAHQGARPARSVVRFLSNELHVALAGALTTGLVTGTFISFARSASGPGVRASSYIESLFLAAGSYLFIASCLHYYGKRLGYVVPKWLVTGVLGSLL